MTKDMTSGNPLKIILLFSLPVLFGNIFQQFYNMFDTIIVGQFLGEDALAAVGATGSIMFLVLGFAMGITQGFGVMVSQAFGAKDIPRLKRYVGISLFLSLVVSVVLTMITVIFSKELLLFMNTPENILDMADSYIKIIFWGILCSMFYNVASGILRGVGDSKTPLYFLILSSFLNIVLDLFCIIVLKLGVAGAAYATVFSQGISAVLCFLYMFRKFDILKISKSDCRPDGRIVWQLISIGIPMALNYSLIGIGSMIQQSAVNVFGSGVVAAFTAASKVEQISVQTMPTLGTTMATYCGQNLGAGKYERIFKGMKDAFWIGLATAVLASLICAGFGRYIVRLFLNSPTDEVMDYVTRYLNTISFFFIFLAFIYLYRTSLQGLGREIMPMISGIFETICRLATVAVLLKPAGYWSVCFANPVAWIGAGVPLMIAYLVWKQKIQKNILQKENE
jgi:putative MATE family efflux protein